MRRATFAAGAAFAIAALASATTSADAPAGHFVIGTGSTAGTVYDTRTKLTWQQGVSQNTYAWADSKSVCSGLALDGGGWRQPSVNELSSIVDYLATGAPFVDSKVFPSTPAALFWSVTPSTASASQAWAVDFNNGYGNVTNVTSAGYVRCVR